MDPKCRHLSSLLLLTHASPRRYLEMSLDEKILNCRDCTQPFVFSIGEQEFFLQKGLKNEPKRCPNCRLVMRVQRNGDDLTHTSEVSCASCGCPTRVPFRPKGYRPVYCVGCFQNKKKEDGTIEEQVEQVAAPVVAPPMAMVAEPVLAY
jgi:CxxC-x17-CxxC domain-containing protein